MLKHLVLKDKKSRNLYKKNELKRFVLKALIYNANLPVFLRENISSILNKYNKYSKTSIRSRCTITYRARGVFTKYRLTRMAFIKFAVLGKLMGIYKKIW